MSPFIRKHLKICCFSLKKTNQLKKNAIKDLEFLHYKCSLIIIHFTLSGSSDRISFRHHIWIYILFLFSLLKILLNVRIFGKSNINALILPPSNRYHTSIFFSLLREILKGKLFVPKLLVNVSLGKLKMSLLITKIF